MSAVSIDILANAKDAVRGAGKAADALDDVGKSLDALVRDSATSGTALGDNITDGAHDASKATDKLEHSFADLAKAAKRNIDDVGTALHKDVKKGAAGATDSVDEFGREANSTAKETAASFDGSADSIVGAFQEVAANAFAGFGPAGAVAGLAAAAGIGLVSAQIATAAAETEDLKAQTSDLAQTYIDAGDAAAPALDAVIDKLKTTATETDDAKTSLTDLKKLADDSGSSYKDLAQAYAGNADGLKDLWRAADRRAKQLEAEETAMLNANRAGSDAYKVLEKQTTAQREYTNYLGKSLGVQRDATREQELFTQAGGDTLTAASALSAEMDAAAAKERDYAMAGGDAFVAKTKLIEGVQGSVDQAAASWEVYSDKEKTSLDPATYLANLQTRLDAAAGYAGSLATAQEKLSPEAYQYLVDQGIDFAPMLASILGGGDQMIADFDTKFSAAAKAGNTAIGSNLTDSFNVEATVDAKTSDAEDKLQQVTDRKREPVLKAQADTRTADAEIAAAAQKRYTATITANAALAQARIDLENFITKPRSVRIVATVVDKLGRTIP